MLVFSLVASRPDGILLGSEPVLEAFVELLLIGDSSEHRDESVVLKEFKDINCDSIAFESSLPVHESFLPVQKFSLQVHKTFLPVHESSWLVLESFLVVQEISLPVHESFLPINESSLPVLVFSLPVHESFLAVHDSSFSKMNIVASPQGGWLE